MIAQRQGSGAGSSPEVQLNRKNTSDPNYNVLNNIELGEIPFKGWYGTSYQTGAAIKATASGVTGVGDMPTDLGLYTSADGSATPTEQVHITNSGKVGFYGDIYPITNDGGALGYAGVRLWSDIFLASGAVINFGSGELTLTSAADLLTLGGGDLAIGTNKITQSGVNLSEQHTIKKIIGWHGAAGCDFTWPDDANTTAHNEDLGFILPAKSVITRIDVVCTEALAGPASHEFAVIVGNASAGDQVCGNRINR